MPHTPKKWIEIVFWFVMLSLSFIAIGFILNAPVARAGTIEPTYTVPSCATPFIIEEKVFVNAEQIPNGLTWVYYRLPDGTIYGVVLQPGDPTKPRYPLFYGFGDEKKPRVTYIDQAQDGTCTGIKVYWEDPKLEA